MRSSQSLHEFIPWQITINLKDGNQRQKKRKEPFLMKQPLNVMYISFFDSENDICDYQKKTWQVKLFNRVE